MIGLTASNPNLNQARNQAQCQHQLDDVLMCSEVTMSAEISSSKTSANLSGECAINQNPSADASKAAMQPSLNISQVCDAAPCETAYREQEHRWCDEHARFIKNYNETIAQEGLPLEQWRSL